MEQDSAGNGESFESIGARFPELDEAARRRVAVRMAAGADAHSAFAQESVAVQLVRVYN
ncbi:MAG TPA: hypothetical protein VE953_19975 [Terriglobales bacterium]|nr:hypothetical protein [Terriglobales bacterium]